MKDHGKAIEELERGREFANQLRQVINGDDKSATQDLAKNMIRSFTNTLFLFGKYPTYESHEVSQRDTSLVKSEDSLLSYKSSTRRGCYKRSKITTQKWEKVSENPTDDHQWRKYGKKAILNSKYSRSYFRCTHKVDQRCQATKQVQRIQEEPPLYRSTYYGHHTCKSLMNPDILHDLDLPPHTSILISFDKTFPTPTKQDCPFLSSFFASPSMNNKEDVPFSSTIDNSSRHVTLSSTLESDHKDMMSDDLNYFVELDDVIQPLLDFDDKMTMF